MNKLCVETSVTKFSSISLNNSISVNVFHKILLFSSSSLFNFAIVNNQLQLNKYLFQVQTNAEPVKESSNIY